MKKVLESRVFTFILGAVIFSSISVYAAHKYYASDITYKETTLDKALDTLYTKTNTYKNLTETTNVEANTLLSGKKAYKSDGTLVNGSIQTYSDAINVTPSNAQQVLQTAGKYMNSNITVGALPSTYKNLTSTTTVTPNNMLNGITAYDNNGNLITGSINTNGIKDTITIPSNYSGTNYIYSCGFKPGFVYIYWSNGYVWMNVNNKSYVYKLSDANDYGQLNNGLNLTNDGFNLNIASYSGLKSLSGTIYIVK